MIFKRAIARLRAQDCFAIAIELAIIIARVFIGTWVANWNADRLERAYCAVVRSFTRVAKAGWAREPLVSDRDFVVAAFQATEISPPNSNPVHDGSRLSVEEVRKIDDADIRDRLMDPDRLSVGNSRSVRRRQS